LDISTCCAFCPLVNTLDIGFPPKLGRMTDIKDFHPHTSSSHLETVPEVENLTLADTDPKNLEDEDPNNPQARPPSRRYHVPILTESLELVTRSKTMHLSDYMLIYLPGQHKFKQFHGRHAAHNQRVPSHPNPSRAVSLLQRLPFWHR
jgi:hypothetical protein